MKILLATGFCTALLALAAPACAPTPADAAARASRTLLRMTGTVTPDNAAAFTAFVAKHQDKVIGLQVRVTPGTPSDFKARHYMAEITDRLFVVFKRGDNEGGIEIVAPKAEAVWLHGDYVLDGFYVVKSGGMHQGTLSYGLQKTDEGVIRANPDVLVRDVALRP